MIEDERYEADRPDDTSPERLQQMRELVEEYPELAHPKAARAAIERAHALVGTYRWSEQLADDPRFWRLVHMAHRAAHAAH